MATMSVQTWQCICIGGDGEGEHINMLAHVDDDERMWVVKDIKQEEMMRVLRKAAAMVSPPSHSNSIARIFLKDQNLVLKTFDQN